MQVIKLIIICATFKIILNNCECIKITTDNKDRNIIINLIMMKTDEIHVNSKRTNTVYVCMHVCR